MAMTFNILQRKFNLVFDFGILATLKLGLTIRRKKRIQNKRQNQVIYQFSFSNVIE
jgi:hypothetical protein